MIPHSFLSITVFALTSLSALAQTPSTPTPTPVSEQKACSLTRASKDDSTELGTETKEGCIDRCLVQNELEVETRTCNWGGSPLALPKDRRPCALLSSDRTPVRWNQPGGPVVTKPECEKICEADRLKTDFDQACFWGGDTVWSELQNVYDFCRISGAAFEPMKAPIFPMTRDLCEASARPARSSSDRCAGGKILWGREVVRELKNGECLKHDFADISSLALLDLSNGQVLAFASAVDSLPAIKWTAIWEQHVIESFQTDPQTSAKDRFGDLAFGDRLFGVPLKIDLAERSRVSRLRRLRARYIVVRQKTSFHSPGGWKLTNPKMVKSFKDAAHLEEAYLAQVRPHTYLVDKQRSVRVRPKSPDWLTVESIYRNRSGQRLISAIIAGQAFGPRVAHGAGDNLEADYGRHWFLQTSPGHYRVLKGEKLDLVEIGDELSSGSDTFLFTGTETKEDDGHRRSVAMLFDNQGRRLAKGPLSDWK